MSTPQQTLTQLLRLAQRQPTRHDDIMMSGQDQSLATTAPCDTHAPVWPA